MASIQNPTVHSENFMTVDEIKSLFESTRVSVDNLSEIDSSTEISSTSSLWESGELDDSSVEETSTVYSGSSPSLSDIEEVSDSDETQRKSAETKLSPFSTSTCRRFAATSYDSPIPKRIRLDSLANAGPSTKDYNDESQGPGGSGGTSGKRTTGNRTTSKGKQTTHGKQSTGGNELLVENKVLMDRVAQVS